MKSPSEEFTALAKLVRTHLEDEFSPQQRLYVDPEHYAFFRKEAQKKLPPEPQKPIPPVPAPIVQKAFTPPPPPAPKPPETVVVKVEEKPPEEPKKSFFELEPMKKAEPMDVGAVGKTFEALFPQLYIEEIPKHKAETAVNFSILYVETDPIKKAFINHFARALFTVYGGVKLVSEDKLSSAAGILIVPQKYAAKVAAHPGGVIIMDEIDLYLKEPARKAALWESVKTLCAR